LALLLRVQKVSKRILHQPEKVGPRPAGDKRLQSHHTMAEMSGRPLGKVQKAGWR